MAQVIGNSLTEDLNMSAWDQLIGFGASIMPTTFIDARYKAPAEGNGNRCQVN